MTTVNSEIPAGTLICFSSGEYSDYGYNGHFVVLEALNKGKINAAIEAVNSRLEAYEEKYEAWRDSGMQGRPPESMDKQESFIAHLIKEGLLLSINVHEIHIGSYSELDIRL